ncbi:hypothetical protein AC578_5453 [Pseudocercospora eumusae]|uniref:Phosphodiesterase n=1 Tax=Pseudocercospora eumusae TaxID=321146 RepID=A0A139HJS6_9PEZI|nr:hypothetical protein AC578_5453 [Pseudocercospora eumusae]
MEEPHDGQCRVVYHCPDLDPPLSELYTPIAPPIASPAEEDPRPPLEHVYSNVRRLLDQDQGNFAQVFVSSDLQQCLLTLGEFDRRSPTAVLVESKTSGADGLSTDALAFLRKLATGCQSGHYQRHVMPFVLVASNLSLDSGEPLESTYSEAGALDVVRSPLDSHSIDRLIGRVKDLTRPSARNLGSSMARTLVAHIANVTRPELACHRPDEILSTQRKAAIEAAVAQWHFPAHEFDMDELTYGALVMLEHILRAPALEAYRMPRAHLMTFLMAARREYKHEREVHYHNWRHAVDVTQSLYVFLCDVRLCPPSVLTPVKAKQEPNAVERLLSPVEALVLLVSAIGHDVGHPGVNNAFLVASDHSLARLYNDKSVLENYHCAAYSQLLRRHWPAVSSIANFRSMMISTILATDMQRHFEYMGYLSDLKAKVEKSEPDLADWSEKDKSQTRELIMALLLKAADISNVARPFDISAEWAKTLMNEFARQGELESELQIPTCLFGGPPDKSDRLAAAQSQKGFMNLFGFPLFRGISEVMPNVSCTLPELEHNKDVWERKIVDEKTLREQEGVGTGSPRTYGSVTDSQVEEARMRKRESEPAVVPTSTPQTPGSPIRRQPNIESGRYGSPAKHPASDQRHRLQLGVSLDDEKRSSTPNLWPSMNGLQLSPTAGASSRRSSKDVALTQLQELGHYAQQNLAPAGSRRGSADAGWQIHQNYPGSRRGSKEESLTTILVTSQGSPANRGSPASSQTKITKPGSPSKSIGIAKRQSLRQNQAQQSQTASGPRYSIPSSRSQTTTSVAATTDQQSPSTQPSSLAPTDDADAVQTGPQHSSFSSAPAAISDPFVATGSWPDSMDGAHHSSAPSALPSTPPDLPLIHSTKSDSPRIIARMASGDSAISRLDPRKSETRVRESRSRSRLRGLKFWKRRRDVSGIDGTATGEYSSS